MKKLIKIELNNPKFTTQQISKDQQKSLKGGTGDSTEGDGIGIEDLIDV